MNKGMAVFAVIEGIPKHEAEIIMIQDKNKPLPRMWKLIGGTTEDGESASWTILREVNEEIGINIIPPTEKDIILKKELQKHIFVTFKAKYYNGSIRRGSEISKLNFFSSEEVVQMIQNGEIVPNHAEALKKYLELTGQ